MPLPILPYTVDGPNLSVVSYALLQVHPSSKLDPCLTPIEEVENQLKSLVLGEDNKLDRFLRKGEFCKAIQLSLSVLNTTNGKADCGPGISIDVKSLVRNLKL